MTPVRNLNQNSEKVWEIVASLNRWETLSGKTIDKCANMACVRKATVAGYVTKDMSSDTECYIIPICRSCNAILSETAYMSREPLVPAELSPAPDESSDQLRFADSF